MTARRTQVRTLAQREFDAVLRTRSYLVLITLFSAAMLAVPLLGGAGGYLPLVLNLSTPVEVLVPTVAFAFGYQAIRADAERGELEVIRTYPVERATYVAGVFAGRSTALLVTIVVPLTVAALAVPMTDQPAPSFLASSATVDDPVFYVRFVVLASLYALVTLAIAVGISAAARSRRHGIALAVSTLLLIVVGLDVAIIAGLATSTVGASGLGTAMVISPASAFRGLVLGLAATPVEGASVSAPAAFPGAIALVGWFAGSLSLAAWTVWED